MQQNTKDDRWRGGHQPTSSSTPSARLRAARTMPPWLARGSAVPPPPPPTHPPPIDPDYEVIEFQNQQAYSNAPPPRPAPPGPSGKGQRCDLCGSSAPVVHCDKCSQQNFCLSCDEMYHRHPKRQAHQRKPLDGSRLPSLRPPLPPKGENSSAPVPPPRRHKRSGRSTPTPLIPDFNQVGFQTHSQKAPVGMMGSIRRIMGSRPLPPTPVGKELRMPASSSPLTFSEMDHQPPSRDSGYLDWDIDSRHRSGSMTALNSPAFSPLMHAQSMAQLNCPSCHHHGLVWDWNQSHMMNPGAFGAPWGGMTTTGTWHGSAMLPPYQPADDTVRRNSMRMQAPPRRSRRDLTTDDEDDSQRRRNTSPVRSRREVMSDSDDDAISHRSNRRHRRRTSPVSRNVSPALSRRSLRKKSSVGVDELIARRARQSEEEILRSGQRYDDETMSNKGGRRYDDESMSNRGGRRYDEETMSNRGGRRYNHETISNRSSRRYHDDDRMSVKSASRFDLDENLTSHVSRKSDFDESMSNHSQKFDDDITSNKSSRRYEFDDTQLKKGGRRTSDARRRQRYSPNQSRMSPVMGKKYLRNASGEDSGDEMSDGMKSTLSRKTSRGDVKDGFRSEDIVKKEEETLISSDVDKPLGPVPNQEWECDHCTFVNQAGSRVCIVCCKTTNNPKYKQENKQQIKEENINENRPHKSDPITPKKQDSSTSPLKEETPKAQIKLKKEELFVKEVVKNNSSLQPQSSKENDNADVDLAERMKTQLLLTPGATNDKKKEYEIDKNSKKTTSTGTSPPPQSISTQTYDVLHKPRLKRAISLADQELWNPHHNASSRQSVTSDSQSLPVTPPRLSPEFDMASRDWETRIKPSRSYSQLSRRPSEPTHNVSRLSRRSGSQPPEYLSTLVQKQVKQGLEMVKLLREAEEQQFSADDLSVALAQCGDGDPVAWLRDNWRNMIDTVVTLATNYGHERKENTVGTISAAEARDALRMHSGNVWSAVNECVDQRLKKYAELMSRGNFTREDIVTVLTANHGNLEAAFAELSKTQLRPFLMRVWGPPQGADNQSANLPMTAQQDDRILVEGQGREVNEEVSDPNFHRIKSWLDTYVHQSIEAHESRLRQGSVDTYPSPKLPLSSSVDPPQVPPRRIPNVVQGPVESDYENIDTGEIKANDIVQIVTAVETGDEANIMHNTIKKVDEKVLGDTGEIAVSMAIKKDIPLSVDNIEQLEIKRKQEMDAGQVGSNMRLLEKEQSPEKQIIVEQLIIDGKVQEIRRYLLNKDEANDLLVSGIKLDSQTQLKGETLDANVKQHLMDNNFTNKVENKAMQKNTEDNIDDFIATNQSFQELRFDNYSNSSSYESIGYMDDDGPENEEESVTPYEEVVTSAKLLVSMDPNVITSVERQNMSSTDKSQFDKSNDASRTESDNDNIYNQQKNIRRSSVSVINVSNIIVHSNIPQNEYSKRVAHITDNNKIYIDNALPDSNNEPMVLKANSNSSNELNLMTGIQSSDLLHILPDANNTKQLHSGQNLDFPSQQSAFSISPSASEIIAYSLENSRDNSSDTEEYEELIEEGGEINNDDGNIYSSREEEIDDTSKSKETLATTLQDMTSKLQQQQQEHELILTEVNGDLIHPESHTNSSPKVPCPDVNQGQFHYVNESKSVKKRTHVKTVTTDAYDDNSLRAVAFDKENSSNTETILRAEESHKQHVGIASPKTNKSNVKDLSPDTQNIISSKESLMVEHTLLIKNEPVIMIHEPNSIDQDTGTRDQSRELSDTSTSNEIVNNLESESINVIYSPIEETNPPSPFNKGIPENLSSKSNSSEGIESAGFIIKETTILKDSQSSPNEHLECTSNLSETNADNNEDVKILISLSEEELKQTEESSLKNKTSTLQNVDFKNQSNTSISTPASMPEYVLNEVLNSASSESDKQSRAGSNSKSVRGSSDQSQASDRSLSMIESRAEILELLKESLSHDLVLDRIVSTLFASVLNHQESQELTKPLDKDEPILPDSEISQILNLNSDDSEVRTESDFFEAQEDVEVEDAEDRGSVVSEVAADDPNVSPRDQINENIIKEINTQEQQEVVEYERQVRRYLAEGVVSTYDQAEVVVKLLELNFDKEQSISAATECSSLESAITFLQQECQLCTGKYPMNQMVSMLECEHCCCHDCALHYFTLQITERSINDCVCPFCKLPQLGSADSDQALEYFSNLDIMLKGLLEETVHELFQRKLRDRTLMEDPNFKWCAKCSSGFIANPRQKKFVCPDCRSVTCASCGKQWEKQHEGISCEAYAAWLVETNDPETQLSKHLADHGVTCPKCNNRYSLSKGGCMHLTCPQCQHEFCVGCGKPFTMGTKCGVSDYCAKLGLHAHHPRNCLFYLRDKEPQLLEKLLYDNGIEYQGEEAGEGATSTRCSVQLQRETADGLQDSLCNLAVNKEGLCRTHFIEYLVKLIGRHKLDPVAILDLMEVQQELRRRGKPLPIRASGQSDADYTALCAQIVHEQIPLE